MRLWTIQPEALFEQLKVENVVYCDPSKSEFLVECDFNKAYNWLAEQMKWRIGNPPDGVKYPIWAWHTLNWRHQKPDLRRIEFRHHDEEQVCIELEIPDEDVLLSDEETWHIVLNDGYYGGSTNESDFKIEHAWLKSLRPEEQKRVKENSWEKIFAVFSPVDTEWDRRGMFIQATFWELRLNQVISVRHFKGRKSKRTINVENPSALA